MTGSYFARLRGDIPTSYKNGIDYYGTNYGSVETVSCSDRVVNACIGFSDYSITGGYKHFSIRILRDSYSVRMGTIYKDYTETASSHFPHKLSYVDKTDLSKVFNMIRCSGKLSRAVVAVVLTLRQLMGDKLTGNDLKAMENLLDHIYHYHSSSIIRQPIVKRVSIRNGGES